MFFFIRKKKLLELEERFQRLCSTVEQNQAQISALEKAVENMQDHTINRMDAVLKGLREEFGLMQSQLMEQSKEISLTSKEVLENLQASMTDRISKIVQKAAQEIQSLQAQLNGQIQANVLTALNATIEDAKQQIETVILSEKDRLREEEKADSEVLLKCLDHISNSLSRILCDISAKVEQADLNMADCTEKKARSVLLEVEKLGKDISEQLALLDESARLLLIHTVADQFDIPQDRRKRY